MAIVVNRKTWLKARRELLKKEKAFTRSRDKLSAERRQLPWVKIDKEYTFEGPRGVISLADLFDGKSQLIIYHLMFDPSWNQPCPSCSFVADNFERSVIHLKGRDIALAAVSRAPVGKLAAAKKQLRWTFKWVSSAASDFNYDFDASFRPRSKDAQYNFEKTDPKTTRKPWRIGVCQRSGRANLPYLLNLRSRP